jgi:hypothetical protein
VERIQMNFHVGQADLLDKSDRVGGSVNEVRFETVYGFDA